MILSWVCNDKIFILKRKWKTDSNSSKKIRKFTISHYCKFRGWSGPGLKRSELQDVLRGLTSFCFSALPSSMCVLPPESGFPQGYRMVTCSKQGHMLFPTDLIVGIRGRGGRDKESWRDMISWGERGRDKCSSKCKLTFSQWVLGGKPTVCAQQAPNPLTNTRGLVIFWNLEFWRF